MFAIVSASVKFSDTAEAYGWVGTGQLIGAAARLGDRRLPHRRDQGATGAFVAATGFAVFGLLVATVFRRASPDLRGRDASPLPDTEPVPIQPR